MSLNPRTNKKVLKHKKNFFNFFTYRISREISKKLASLREGNWKLFQTNPKKTFSHETLFTYNCNKPYVLFFYYFFGRCILLCKEAFFNLFISNFCYPQKLLLLCLLYFILYGYLRSNSRQKKFIRQ